MASGHPPSPCWASSSTSVSGDASPNSPGGSERRIVTSSEVTSPEGSRCGPRLTSIWRDAVGGAAGDGSDQSGARGGRAVEGAGAEGGGAAEHAASVAARARRRERRDGVSTEAGAYGSRSAGGRPSPLTGAA